MFTPGAPAATDIGMEALTGQRDFDLAKQLVAEAGYAGEKVVILAPTDYPFLEAFCEVTRDLLGKLGVAVDYVATDWGTVVQRRASKSPPDQGGWNLFSTGWEGLNVDDPAGHYPIIGSGQNAWFGWPTSPRMEALAQRLVQRPGRGGAEEGDGRDPGAVWEEVPYIPLGQFFQPAVQRTVLTDVVDGPFPIFWGARKG